MTPRERDQVAALCAQHAGLDVDTERSYLMESRLAAVARREGYAAIPDLVRAVRERGETRLTWAVVESMAPVQSGFFRDPEALEAAVAHIDACGRRGRVRVWSAACGTGQEIYSLAMLLEERGIEGVELFASDLSERSLEKAKAGLYTAFEAQQGLSARRLVRHFGNLDELFLLDAELRGPVKWRRLNLIETPGGVGVFDLILCRRYLAALLPAARDKAAANLAAALRPGGRLILGAGETVPPAAGLIPVVGSPGVFESPDAIRAAA